MMRFNLIRINKIIGAMLIILTLLVTIPLIVKTIRTGGGTWGFGMAGIPILLPLSGYLIFGLAPYFRHEERQKNVFLLAHVVTLAIGITCFLIFPVYPTIVMVPPLALFILSVFNLGRFKFYLLLCIMLALILNIMFLVWEIQFGRTLPILQLFEENIPADLF